MMDDATAPDLRSRMTEWFTDPSGWDMKGEALEEYARRPDAVRYSHQEFFDKARTELL